MSEEEIAAARREIERRVAETGGLPPHSPPAEDRLGRLLWGLAERPRAFRTAGILFRVGFFAFCTVLGYYGVWVGGTHLSSVPHSGGLRGVLYGGGSALFVLVVMEIAMRRRRRYS